MDKAVWEQHSMNEVSEVALATKFKRKCSQQRDENDEDMSSKSSKRRKTTKCFYCRKLEHISKV